MAEHMAGMVAFQEAMQRVLDATHRVDELGAELETVGTDGN